MSTATIKLLVVDDDLNFLEFLNSRLSHDFTIITATNGSEGLQLFTSEQPDVVMTDLIMPGLDGFIFLGEIEKIRKTPAIVVSGGFTPGVEQALTRIGARCFLQKPVPLEELKTQIRELAAEATS